ncbi:MAG: secretin N-terminal domain-containing protein [Rubripirellula sp.]
MRHIVAMSLLISAACIGFAQEVAPKDRPGLPSEMRVFYLQNADVAQAAKLIENLLPEEIRKGGTTVLPEARLNALYVQGNPTLQEWVEAFLLRYDKDTESRTLRAVSDLITETMELKEVDPREALDVIESLDLVGDDLTVAIVPRGKRLIVRGPKEAVGEIRDLLVQLDEPPADRSSTFGRSKARPGSLVVSLKANGQVLVAGEKLKPGNFADSFNANSTVLLDVDRDVHHAEVVDLIEQLRKAGVARLSVRASNVPQPNDSPQKNTTGKAEGAWTPTPTQPLQQAYASAEQAAAATAAKWRWAKDRSPKNNDELKVLESALAKEVRAAFRLRQQWQQLQLDQHQAELDRLANRLDRREKIVDQIVAHRVRELQSGKDLSWLPDGKGIASKPAAGVAPNLPPSTTAEAAGMTSPLTKSAKNATADRAAATRPRKPDVSSQASSSMTAPTQSSPSKSSPNSGDEASKQAAKANVSEVPEVSEVPARLCEVSDRGRQLTINARDQEHAAAIREFLGTYFSREEIEPVSSTQFVVRRGEETIQQIVEYVEDIDRRAHLRAAIDSATQVPIELFVSSAAGVSWALDDVQYKLPADFSLDADQRLLLELVDCTGVHGRSMYASIQVSTLSKDALEYFRHHKLRIGITIPDLLRAREGAEVTKSYYLVRRGKQWKLDSFSTLDRPGAGAAPEGERIAELEIGSRKPHLTDGSVRSRTTSRGGLTKFELGDSVVFVEMIVASVGPDAEATQRRAIYMDGTVVGDEGLVAIVIDDLLDDDGKLNVEIESITLKTKQGKAIYDASLVAQDPALGLALLRSDQLPVPPLRLDGPPVVESQGIQVHRRAGTDAGGVTVFHKTGTVFDTRVLKPNGFVPKYPQRFLLRSSPRIPGAAATLVTTGQLVGILAGSSTPIVGEGWRELGRQAVSAVAVDSLVRRYRKQ